MLNYNAWRYENGQEKPRNYSAEFKAKVALEAIRGDLTINEISKKYSVHSTQINRRKQQALSSIKTSFTGKQQKADNDNQKLKGFQHFHDNEFGLIIGNPPYASFTVFDKKHPDRCDEMIHHYFVAKSVRLLKENGLLAMAVPCYILDNPKRHLREQISEVAELAAAYQLPQNLFDDATTVDVVIFQRKFNPNTEWSNTSLANLSDKKTSYLSDYFLKHPKHIIGELSTYEAYSFFEDRPRRGLCCKGSIEMVQQRLLQLLNAVRPIILQ